MAGAKSTKDNVERDTAGRFLTGHKAAGPGRPKGSKHALSETFLKAMAEDFEANGVSAIQKMREDDPSAYVRVVASLVPKESTLTINKYDELTDEQLTERLAEIHADLAAFLAGGTAGSAGTSGGNRTATKH